MDITPLSPNFLLQKILLVRGRKVILDFDLGLLYEVATKRINEQVKRNPDRFPDDFMFQLLPEEWMDLKSQIATSSLIDDSDWGGRRKMPYAFTEHGVLMLSSVLNSSRAVAVNIQIMRTFISMREIAANNTALFSYLKQIELQIGEHDEHIRSIFACLQELLQPAEKVKIGFKKD